MGILTSTDASWPKGSLASQPLLRKERGSGEETYFRLFHWNVHYLSLCDVYLTAMCFAMIIISALACYFLCDLDQQKKFKIAAMEDTEDKQRRPKMADKR